jgi:hypothetical protein
VAKNGADFGLMNGMGSVAANTSRARFIVRIAWPRTGIYDDGRKGIRRLTDPEPRLGDQERDGVQAEVLYGTLGASMRLHGGEAATAMLPIYNQ